jgi:hypothetical protein
MMQVIPLKALPAQKTSFLASGQMVGLNIYVLTDGNLYMDVMIADVPVVTGVLCRNLVKVIRNLYFNFIGDFVFTDTQGSNDPAYAGLGTRYTLNYLTAAEAANV